MQMTRAVVAGIGLALASLVTGPAVSFADTTGDPSAVDNTGVADTAPASTDISPAVAARMQDKFDGLTRARAQIAARAAGVRSPQSCGSQGCSSTGHAPIANTLFFEGQGSTMWGTEPTWTCGPSA